MAGGGRGGIVVHCQSCGKPRRVGSQRNESGVTQRQREGKWGSRLHAEPTPLLGLERGKPGAGFYCK
jgi:hypothetical protein